MMFRVRRADNAVLFETVFPDEGFSDATTTAIADQITAALDEGYACAIEASRDKDEWHVERIFIPH